MSNSTDLRNIQKAVWRTAEEHGWHEKVGVELADVVIRVLDLAEMLDIDLTGIILTKMKYNESRPYRHGNKRV